MLDKELQEKMKEAVDEFVKNLKEDKQELLKEVKKQVEQALNSRTKVKIEGNYGKIECELLGNPLVLLLILERVKLKLINNSKTSEEIIEAIQNIAKEMEKENGK